MITIESSDNTISTSELASELDSLQVELDDLTESVSEGEPDAAKLLAAWREEHPDFEAFKKFAEEVDKYSGDLLINESYFTEHVKEQFTSGTEHPDLDTWPYNCINWEEAASEAMSDYTVFDWDGTTFYMS